MLLQVMLSNNCAMDTCVTDFSPLPGRCGLPPQVSGVHVMCAPVLLTTSLPLSLPLPCSGMGFQSIEVGGVKEVEVKLTLANNGPEDAIDLTLTVGNSVENVFAEQFKITFQSVCMSLCMCTCIYTCPSMPMCEL